MESIEVSTNQMEDTEWNLWQLLLSKENAWVKSVTNSSNIFFEEVSLYTRSIEYFISVKQLGVSWVWYIQLRFNSCSSVTSDSTFKIFV